MKMSVRRQEIKSDAGKKRALQHFIQRGNVQMTERESYVRDNRFGKKKKKHCWLLDLKRHANISQERTLLIWIVRPWRRSVTIVLFLYSRRVNVLYYTKLSWKNCTGFVMMQHEWRMEHGLNHTHTHVTPSLRKSPPSSQCDKSNKQTENTHSSSGLNFPSRADRANEMYCVGVCVSARACVRAWDHIENNPV